MKTGLLAIFSVLVGGLEGAAAGLLMVFVFYRPGRLNGLTIRMQHFMATGLLLFFLGYFWVGAFKPSLYGAQSGLGRPEGFALAFGCTVGGGWLAIRRWRRHRRNLAAVSSGGGIHPAEHHVKGSALRRWVRFVIRCCDYTVGAGMCFGAIFGAATFSDYVRGKSAHWFTGQTHTLVVIGTYVVIAAAGLAYSQLISGSALRAMNTALDHDWGVTRNWHYILLAPPFLLVTPYAVVAPGLMLGVVSHLANLWVGWRFTNGRPTTPLRTLKAVQQHRAGAQVAKPRPERD